MIKYLFISSQISIMITFIICTGLLFNPNKILSFTLNPKSNIIEIVSPDIIEDANERNSNISGMIELKDPLGVVNGNLHEKLKILQNGFPTKWKNDTKQLQCLADNIFKEARGEKKEGQYLVGVVTLNRVMGGKWGNNPCAVVYGKINNKGKIICEFSWVCQDKYVNRNSKQYRDIKNLAQMILAGDVFNRYPKALYYCNPNTEAKCVWHNTLRGYKRFMIGNHKFFQRIY